MGVDLTIAPDRWSLPQGGERDWWLANNRLDLLRNYHLYDQIKALPSSPLEPDTTFGWYGDDGVERETEDAYGNPLRYVRAGDLGTIPDQPDYPAWNRAVLAFVRALPPETRIMLWWH